MNFKAAFLAIFPSSVHYGNIFSPRSIKKSVESILVIIGAHRTNLSPVAFKLAEKKKKKKKTTQVSLSWGGAVWLK